MQGTVDRVWRNERPDGSEYWVLSIDGKRYSAWEPELVQNVQPGDRVDFAFINAGRYRNLTALRRLPPEGPASSPDAQALRIVRMSCLRTATKLIAGTTMLPEEKVAEALTIAEKLVNHVLGRRAAGMREPEAPDVEDDPEREEPHVG